MVLRLPVLHIIQLELGNRLELTQKLSTVSSPGPVSPKAAVPVQSCSSRSLPPPKYVPAGQAEAEPQLTQRATATYAWPDSEWQSGPDSESGPGTTARVFWPLREATVTNSHCLDSESGPGALAGGLRAAARDNRDQLAGKPIS